MKVANIALQERTVDNDFSIYCTSDKGEVKGFIVSKELLQFLRDSIDKKLKEN